MSLQFIGMVFLKNWVGYTMVYQKLEDIWAVPAYSGSSLRFRGYFYCLQGEKFFNLMNLTSQNGFSEFCKMDGVLL